MLYIPLETYGKVLYGQIFSFLCGKGYTIFSKKPDKILYIGKQNKNTFFTKFTFLMYSKVLKLIIQDINHKYLNLCIFSYCN